MARSSGVVDCQRVTICARLRPPASHDGMCSRIQAHPSEQSITLRAAPHQHVQSQQTRSSKARSGSRQRGARNRSAAGPSPPPRGGTGASRATSKRRGGRGEGPDAGESGARSSSGTSGGSGARGSERERRFVFDHAFDPRAAQADVYRDAGAAAVLDALRGVSSTVLAYGQTGSGKTYTLFGPSLDGRRATAHDASRLGLIPRAMHELFEAAARLGRPRRERRRMNLRRMRGGMGVRGGGRGGGPGNNGEGEVIRSRASSSASASSALGRGRGRGAVEGVFAPDSPSAARAAAGRGAKWRAEHEHDHEHEHVPGVRLGSPALSPLSSSASSIQGGVHAEAGAGGGAEAGADGLVECEVESWSEFRFSVSFLQLYLGRAQDLLEHHDDRGGGGGGGGVTSGGSAMEEGEEEEGDEWGPEGGRQGGAVGSTRHTQGSRVLRDLEVRDGPGGSWVRGLGEHACSDVRGVLGLLSEGARQRTVASTAWNHASSRGHSFFLVRVRRR